MYNVVEYSGYVYSWYNIKLIDLKINEMDVNKFRAIIPNFLTQEECVGFIEFAEGQGFKKELTGISIDSQVTNTDDNNKYVFKTK
jgi:hypothetical protein